MQLTWAYINPLRKVTTIIGLVSYVGVCGLNYFWYWLIVRKFARVYGLNKIQLK